MCLEIIRQRTNLPRIGTGVKRFSTDYEGHYSFQITGGRIKTDVWMKAKSKRISSGNGRTYETGFHIYGNGKESPNDYPKSSFYLNQRPVFWRDPICLGRQSGRDVLVVRELFIPSQRMLKKLENGTELLMKIFAQPIGKKLD